MAAVQERIGGGFPPGSLRGVVAPASAEGGRVAPQDADVDPSDRSESMFAPVLNETR